MCVCTRIQVHLYYVIINHIISINLLNGIAVLALRYENVFLYMREYLSSIRTLLPRHIVSSTVAISVIFSA